MGHAVSKSSNSTSTSSKHGGTSSKRDRDRDRGRDRDRNGTISHHKKKKSKKQPKELRGVHKKKSKKSKSKKSSAVESSESEEMDDEVSDMDVAEEGSDVGSGTDGENDADAEADADAQAEAEADANENEDSDDEVAEDGAAEEGMTEEEKQARKESMKKKRAKAASRKAKMRGFRRVADHAGGDAHGIASNVLKVGHVKRLGQKVTQITTQAAYDSVDEYKKRLELSQEPLTNTPAGIVTANAEAVGRELMERAVEMAIQSGTDVTAAHVRRAGRHLNKALLYSTLVPLGTRLHAQTQKDSKGNVCMNMFDDDIDPVTKTVENNIATEQTLAAKDKGLLDKVN